MNMNRSTSAGMGTDMGMNQGSSLGMDMGMDQGSSSCKMAMLWNWFTVDACFISDHWHARSKVAFAFSVVFMFTLVAMIEGVRRVGREYDRGIVYRAREIDSSLTKADGLDSSAFAFKPSHKQQLIRALIFAVQLGAAYMAMLVAMSFNGYIIFAIILGGGVGHFVFGRDTTVGAMSYH